MRSRKGKKLVAAIGTQSTEWLGTLGNCGEHTRTCSRLPHLPGEVSFWGGRLPNMSCLPILPVNTRLWGLGEKEQRRWHLPSEVRGRCEAEAGAVGEQPTPVWSHIHSGDVPIFYREGCRLSYHLLKIVRHPLFWEIFFPGRVLPHRPGQF